MAVKKPVVKKPEVKKPEVKKVVNTVTKPTTTKQPETFADIIKKGVIKIVPIDSVLQWKENPRKFDSATVATLAGLIKPHGQVSDIIVWTKNNTIYKGNRTQKALKTLGYKTISVKFVDFTSEDMAIAYGTSDNVGSDSGMYDYELLNKIKNNLTVSNPNAFKATGFTEKVIERHLKILNKEKEKPIHEDKAKIIVVYTEKSMREPLIMAIKEIAKTKKLDIIDII